MYLIEAESDVAQLLCLFPSLKLQLETTLKAWWLDYGEQALPDPHEKTIERHQFQLSFLANVGHGIEAVHSSEAAAAEPATSMLLAGRRERADEHVQALYPALRSALRQPISYGSSFTHAAGSHAGTSASVNGAVDAARRNALAGHPRIP